MLGVNVGILWEENCLKIFLKICFFLVCLGLVYIGSFSFGYQYEWFTEYQEWEEWISFKCEKKCYISLWKVGRADYLNISWEIGGTGNFIIFSERWNLKDFLYLGFLSSTSNAYVKFSDYDEILLFHLQNDRWLWVEFYWNISWFLKVNKLSFTFLQKILIGRKDFWLKESIYPNIVNLREGIYILWKSILVYWYIAFLLSLLCIIIFVRRDWRQKFKIIFYIWLWFFLFIWIRNTINYTYILNQWISWFRTNKNLFDLEDFFPFVERIRDKLDLNFNENVNQDCKIFVKSETNRNIDDHGWFYFKPCEHVSVWDLADYKVYYKMSIPPEDLDKHVLVEFNGSYLLDNKVK